MRADTRAFAAKNQLLQKEPRYVIEIAFDSALTVLRYFTSHVDAALPAGATAFQNVVRTLSGTSQTLNPDIANATIGNFNFSLVDRAGVITLALGGQLALGRSTRTQRVRVYVGYAGLSWADYSLVQTQIVQDVSYKDGAYSIRCLDIQRQMRKDIFDVASTRLTLSLLAADSTVNVTSTSDFQTVAHGTSYSDAPSATVGYIRIEDEVIRYTGKNSTQFTGCTRGALNTLAVDHLIDASATQDQLTEVKEYVYLEMPVLKLMYAILTGVLYNQGGATLPDSWHLGIDPSYVRLSDFIDPSKIDLYNPADDDQGFMVVFQAMTKTDGKQFIEKELALLVGVFMPIYASGELGCRRMANILTGAGYSAMLDETNVVSFEDLLHDFGAMHNVLEIDWNYEPLQQAFTRKNFLVDAGSTSIYGSADTLKLAFRGLFGSRHSASMLQGRFDAFRDRYSAPPWRINVNTYAVLNGLEVGEVVRVRLANLRDYVASSSGVVASIDRSFEVQNISVDWQTGRQSLKLMATSRAPDAAAATADATVLSSAFYTGTGTDLSTVLTITGSNPGHISANGNLAGNADMNNAGAIYFYNGDLQLDAGVTVTVNNNVQLRVKGFFQRNGKIDGKGRGLAGAAVLPGPLDPNAFNSGTQGFIGTTIAGGGITALILGGETPLDSVSAPALRGLNDVVPLVNLSWDGTTLSGIPGDLRGTSGSSGLSALAFPPQPSQSFAGIPGASGGAGGSSGAGLAIICRGTAAGVSGVVDLSGGDGAPGDDRIGGGFTFHAGSGAGGAPGALLVLLDGASVSSTGLTDAGFVALNGATPIRPGVFPTPRIFLEASGQSDFYSYYVGTGDGTAFPLPTMSGARGASRVQYIPANPLPARDEILFGTEDATEALAANWTLRAPVTSRTVVANAAAAASPNNLVVVGSASAALAKALIVYSEDAVIWSEQANPKQIALNDVVWSPDVGLYVAVGAADGGDAYILSSPDGKTWTERANALNLNLSAVTWSRKLGLFCAVGSSTGSIAYILTSPDGITWTQRTSGLTKAVGLVDIAWCPELNLFCAIGGNGVSYGGGPSILYVITSPDGVTWAEDQSTSSANTGHAIVAHKSHFVAAVSAAGNPSIIIHSLDGLTWLTASFGFSIFCFGLASSGDLLVAVGTGVSSSRVVATSRSGVVWKSRENPSQAGLFRPAWTGRRFIVGTDGVSAPATTYYVMTSLEGAR